MKLSQYKTASGIEVEVSLEELDLETALDGVFSQVDTKKGAIFSSGFDYPGRHSRWDLGFVDPALEIVSRGRKFSINALNGQGELILGVIQNAVSQLKDIENIIYKKNSIGGEIIQNKDFFIEEVRSKQPSLFSLLRTLINLFYSEDPLAIHFGFYGAFGYDLVLQFEQLKLKHARDQSSNDCHLFLPLDLVAVDRKRELAHRLKYSLKTASGLTKDKPASGENFELSRPQGSEEVLCDHAPGEFAKKVQKVIAGTERGDYFEVVLSQSFETRLDEKPTEVFRRLAKINPSPYMFLLNFGTEQLLGASPELYVRVSGKRYETCPIAGTVQRGESALEDAAKVQELMSSKKDESELTMCTDVDRNDMARVCEPGSVRVIGRRQLEFYSHLIHTVDHVEGYLRDGFDALDAFQTHMWACTVTGAPKPAALQEIENLEASPRGWYSGAIGMLGSNGSVNTGITLRSALLKNGRAHFRAGATLLYGSDPEAEERETRTKAAAFLAALAQVKKHSANKEAKTLERFASKPRLLLVDYKDSFVHNLAAYLREIGAEVITVRAGFPEEMLDSLKPQLVFLSPGPGRPEDFGLPNFVGRLASKHIPTFGVCLGLQGMGQHFGATLGTLPTPEHGKASLVKHENDPIFNGIQNFFEAGRYHSLYLIDSSIPNSLEVIAHVEEVGASGKLERIPMAIRHKKLPMAAVQFHPESLMTLKNNAGHRILLNAIRSLSGIY